MDTINFVDEFGMPHVIEVEEITEEEYNNFGGSEINSFVENFIDEKLERGNKMKYLNTGIVYDVQTGKAYIINDDIRIEIDAETDRQLHSMEYNSALARINKIISNINNYQQQTHHNYECCDHNHNTTNQKSIFSNLIVDKKPPYENTYEKKKKSVSGGGIFARYTSKDSAPTVIKEDVQVDDHKDFTSSLKYHIDYNTGAVYVLHTKTGVVDLADRGEIDSLYRNCPEFKNDYDRWIMHNPYYNVRG